MSYVYNVIYSILFTKDCLNAFLFVCQFYFIYCIKSIQLANSLFIYHYLNCDARGHFYDLSLYTNITFTL